MHAPGPIVAGPAEPVTVRCPRPVARPVMHQGWLDLASVHWWYDVDAVQRLLPAGFRCDTFAGRALVGLLPFRMERIRFGPLPPFGRWASFPETNVRTYVVDRRGRRGVWFFSLDIDRLAPALIARATYRLPYCWGRMHIERRGDVVEYRSHRHWPAGRTAAGRTAVSHIAVRIGAPLDDVDPDGVEAFVSARWALGTTFGRMAVFLEREKINFF